jgi:hypothetical protein
VLCSQECAPAKMHCRTCWVLLACVCMRPPVVCGADRLFDCILLSDALAYLQDAIGHLKARHTSVYVVRHARHAACCRCPRAPSLLPSRSVAMCWLCMCLTHLHTYKHVTIVPACLIYSLQVSKGTFLAALKERGAVMFCPGGQAELVHAWRSFLPETQRELVLQKRHKGFCRCGLSPYTAGLLHWCGLQHGPPQLCHLCTICDVPVWVELACRLCALCAAFVTCAIDCNGCSQPSAYVVGYGLSHWLVT